MSTRHMMQVNRGRRVVPRINTEVHLHRICHEVIDIGSADNPAKLKPRKGVEDLVPKRGGHVSPALAHGGKRGISERTCLAVSAPSHGDRGIYDLSHRSNRSLRSRSISALSSSQLRCASASDTGGPWAARRARIRSAARRARSRSKVAIG